MAAFKFGLDFLQRSSLDIEQSSTQKEKLRLSAPSPPSLPHFAPVEGFPGFDRYLLPPEFTTANSAESSATLLLPPQLANLQSATRLRSRAPAVKQQDFTASFP